MELLVYFKAKCCGVIIPDFECRKLVNVKKDSFIDIYYSGPTRPEIKIFTNRICYVINVNNFYSTSKNTIFTSSV